MTKPKRDDYDESWSMPFGDSIYTHAPESKVGSTGTATGISDKPSRKRARRIGFRPPQEVK